MATVDCVIVNPERADYELVADTKASLDTDSTQGANAAVVYTAALAEGTDGHRIKIEYVVPTDDNAAHALAVTVSESGDIQTISVSLEVDTDGSTILSTADEVKAAIAANAEANALVTAADKAANDGSGVVSAFAATALSGGVDAVVVKAGGLLDYQFATEADAVAVLADGMALIPDAASYAERRALGNATKYGKVL